MAGFLRGTPVIINDFDAPQARMIACIMGWDGHLGVLKARYLNPYTNMRYCWAERPTPVADFGMTVELDAANGQYRVVPHGIATAKYADGKIRNWQDYGGSIGVWYVGRPPALALLETWLRKEVEKIDALAHG